MNVPLYNVCLPESTLTAISGIFRSRQIANGSNVALFEKLLGDYLRHSRVTTTSDISTSLTLCLFQSGVKPGDEVIMSPMVCLSTSCPVRNLFANIRWCDVDPTTGNIDPKDLAKRITSRTKAVVVYHWAGNPSALEEIHSVARDHDLVVIEDAGEALGAEYHGKMIGATGSDYTVFSFYPNRHLTTIEGGAIACAREEDYEKLRWLKRYGIHQPGFRRADGEINPESDIPVAGWNSYMNHVAATIGVTQMANLPSLVARHQDNGIYYDEQLADVPGLGLLKRPDDSKSSFWVYTFLARDRDKLLARLRNHGVHASKVHIRNDIYSCFGEGLSPLPGVEYFSSHCLSIPCGWWVEEADRIRIVDIIRREAF